MSDQESYYDSQGRLNRRKTSTADDVEDAQTTERLQNFKAPAAGSKPRQSDEEPADKKSLQWAIWNKRQQAKQAGQRAAANKL